MIYALRFVLIVLYTIYWGSAACVLGLFNGELVVWCARAWLRWIFRSCGVRVRAEGLAHIDTGRPQVVMSNHQSALDIGALILTLPISWRFVSKRELGWIPLFGWALWISGQVMIDRGNRARAVESLRAAARRIARGTNVIIFPEGTRSPDGRLADFKSGGFHLAIQAGVPILPVAISGGRALLPKKSLKVHSGVMTVVYGRPISTAGLSSAGDRRQLKQRVREAMEAGFAAAATAAPDPGAAPSPDAAPPSAGLRG